MLPVADGSDYGGSLRNPAGWNNVFGLRPSIGRIPSDARDMWLPYVGVARPMAKNVADLAMFLSVQAGFDSRAPLSLGEDGSMFERRLDKNIKGKRIAWGGDFAGHTPCEPGILETCRAAVRIFESLGCIVEDAIPDFDFEALWRAAQRLRGWQQGGALLEYYNDPAKRDLLKAEAIFEVETGLRQSAFDISAASIVRTEWSEAVRRFFERYDFLILPTAQVFPFDIALHWPKEIAGRKMQTYHEWMKAALFIAMSGCPALAAPAGFGADGLPIGIQIVAPNRRELSCLELAYAYESALPSGDRRLAPLPAHL
jgi:amidase